MTSAFRRRSLLKVEQATDPWERRLDRAALLLVGVVACWAAARPFLPEAWSRHPWMTWVRDDFFYYLAIAENLATGHGSTFNRLVATNGYHPLWMVFLVAVCRISTAPRFIIGAIALSCVFATVATFLVCNGILRSSAVATPMRVLLASYLALNSLELFFYGMEVTLAIPLALLLMLYLLRPVTMRGARWWVGLGALISALALARLDGLLLAVMLAAACLCVPSFRRSLNYRATAALMLGLLPIAAYFVTNRWIFGLWLPVSGLAKQLRTGYAPSAEVWASVLVASRFDLFNLALVVAGLLRLPLVWKRLNSLTRAVLGATTAFPFVFVLLLSVRSDWGMWPWYAWVWRPALCASLAVWMEGSVQPVWLRDRRVHAGLTALIALTVAVRIATTAWPPGQNDFVEAAVNIRNFAVTHPGIYAMGDRAGRVAYLLPQPLVQTEGLVMDHDFLQHIRHQDDLFQTLALYHVRYYVASSWDGDRFYRDGCLHAVEPVQAGDDSPHMRGTLCEAPLLRVKHNGVETMVFALP